MSVEDALFNIIVYQSDIIPVGKWPDKLVWKDGEWVNEEYAAIFFRFVKLRYSHRSLSDPVHQEITDERLFKLFWPVWDITQRRRNSYLRNHFKRSLLYYNLPETVYGEILDKLFPVIYATECFDVPILVLIEDWRQSDEVLSYTPTAASAIEGLERVRLDDGECAICCKDFTPEDGTLTRMPCSHCSHGDCIVPWLSVNHLCPMCRYPMPVSSSYNPLRPEMRGCLYVAAAEEER